MLQIFLLGERFRYHSKSKERLIYHTRIIKDFHTIADLVVAHTNYYYTKVIHLIVAIPTITIGDKALWPRNHRNFRSAWERSSAVYARDLIHCYLKRTYSDNPLINIADL